MWGIVQRHKWSLTTNDLQTGNDPHIGPQMIRSRKWSCWKTRNGMEFVPRVEVSIFNISKHKQKQITTNHILQRSIWIYWNPMIKSSLNNYRKSSAEFLAIGFCLYIAITFNRRENCEQINNVSSVTQYPIRSCLFPGLHDWLNLGRYRFFMSGFRFWSITWDEKLLSSMLKVSSREF